MRHRVAAAVCLALIGFCSATPSAASASANAGNNPTPPPAPTGQVSNGSPEAIVISTPGGSPRQLNRPGNGRRGRWDCIYNAMIGVDVLPEPDVTAGPIRPTPQQLVQLRCWDETGALAYTKVFVYDPADPLAGLDAPERAADEARKLLPLAPPVIELSPPATTPQLVGVATWLWLGDPWQPLRASATLGGVTSTVTARPTTVQWLLGDGSTVTCAGPGTPYDTGRSPESQRSDCTHTFQRRGQFAVTATVTYEAAWTATTGDGGVLGPVVRTATLPITVNEAQALIR